MKKFRMRDFSALSAIARNQLGGVQDSLNDNPYQKRTVLVNRLILPAPLDLKRGLYYPVSAKRKLYARMPHSFEALPQYVLPKEGTDLLFFGNALALPKGWTGPQCDLSNIAKPKLRLTNSGLLFVTHEFDPKPAEQLEEQLGWLRSEGGFEQVDGALRQYRDYRGFCAVYSGNKSLHFHFIFNTEHIQQAPFDAARNVREEKQLADALLMAQVHGRCWDHTREVMASILKPSIESDRALRSAVQWRRLPWGNRPSGAGSELIPSAHLVPQLVITENILMHRAPKGSRKWLVEPGFCGEEIQSLPRRVAWRRPSFGDQSAIIERLSADCRAEWGCDFPQPVAIERDGEQYLIRFKNGLDDQNPSTIAKGDHRKLLLQGQHEFDRDFFLPDDLSAHETIDFYNGGRERSKIIEPVENHSETLLDRYAANIGRGFSRENNGCAPETAARKALQSAIMSARSLAPSIRSRAGYRGDYLINSVEGIGKSTAHYIHLSDEGLDSAIAAFDAGAAKNGTVIQRFSVMACRSIDQAKMKAKEIENHDHLGHFVTAVVMVSFWQRYKAACEEAGCEPIPRRHLRGDFYHQYREIRDLQPQVFKILERQRKTLWARSKFDCGLTILCTSHAMVQHWHQSSATRVWHHPDFDPDDPEQDREVLRSAVAFGRVVYDELEVGDLIYCLSEDQFELIKAYQEEYGDWRNLSRAEREDIWTACGGKSTLTRDFETFDQWMRIGLSSLSRQKVDFDAIPIFDGRNTKDIYRKCHGDVWYVGFRDWTFKLHGPIAYLTTEQLPAEVLRALYEHHNKLLLVLDLKDFPGLSYPAVSVSVDARAQKRKIESLARELTQNSNVWVIANNCRSVERTINFQNMKGSNELRTNDIVIIPTAPSVPQYAQLNIIGQVCGLPNIIQLHYADLLNQAIGRNQGFRRSGASVRIICSSRLRKWILSKLNQSGLRYLLD